MVEELTEDEDYYRVSVPLLNSMYPGYADCHSIDTAGRFVMCTVIRLGHRAPVDFDSFTFQTFDLHDLAECRTWRPGWVTRGTQVQQDQLTWAASTDLGFD
jgi:hypothetical protein